MAVEAGNSGIADSIFSGSEKLLNYGPLGLAGLMLVLVVIVLLIRKVDPTVERVLKLCLFVGALCFVAALVAQHYTPTPIYDSGLNSKLRRTLANVVSGFDSSIAALNEVNTMALDNGCPGGPHGIAIPKGGAMASRSSAVIASLNFAKRDVEAVIDNLPTSASH